VLASATALTGTSPAKKKTHAIRPLLPPIVAITAATEVDKNSARLNGTVVSVGTTNYKFEYGTTGFTQSTSTTAGLIGSLAVNKKISGLQPSTTYMWRLVAGSTISATSYFTTSASNSGSSGSSGSGSSGSGSGSSGSGSGSSGSNSGHGTGNLDLINVLAPVAQLASSVVAAPSTSIDIKLPGASEFVSLGSTAGIPNGSTIRAGSDEVGITSIDQSGKQQTGYFWGGTFKISQLRNGLVELKVVSDFSACGKAPKHGTRSVSASAAKVKKGKKGKKGKKASKTKGSLWGRDSGGKFRTKGRSSVATVRGTRWYTEDRCDGTLTKVSQGKVSVDPKKGKTTLVSAGKSFFAKR